jgi:hypothetical protein
MSISIGEPVSHISACIWGKPYRKNQRIEAKIAEFLNVSKEELFGMGF